MSKQIIPEALRWLNITGLNVEEQKFYFRGYAMILLSTVVFIMECLQMCAYFNNVDIFAGVVEVCAPVYLSLIKILAMAMYRKHLYNITKEIKAFWSTNKYGDELRDHLENMFVTVKTMLLGYRWLAIVTTSMIIPLKPILSGKGGLPIDIWQPFDMLTPPYYHIIYVLESMVGYFASFVNIAVDSLYVGYITHVIAQFILLKHALKNIDMKFVETYQDEEICWNQMKECIKYHNHLLTMIEDIQKSHSLIFLNMFATSTLTICIDMYSVAYDGILDIVRLIKYIFQCSFFIFLAFLYCFTATQLTYQCLSVADAVYESEWYQKPLPRIRGGVSLMMLRAQKVVYLTAGGLMTLDLENFIRVLRLAFSVFTLIRTQTQKV